jgi:hypothetical protein
MLQADSRTARVAGKKVQVPRRLRCALARRARLQQLGDAAAKFRIQCRKKFERFGRENRLKIRARRRSDPERFAPLLAEIFTVVLGMRTEYRRGNAARKANLAARS